MLKQLRSTLFVKLTIGSFKLGETACSVKCSLLYWFSYCSFQPRLGLGQGVFAVAALAR